MGVKRGRQAIKSPIEKLNAKGLGTFGLAAGGGQGCAGHDQIDDRRWDEGPGVRGLRGFRGVSERLRELGLGVCRDPAGHFVALTDSHSEGLRATVGWR
jgi:hypothetical protein